MLHTEFFAACRPAMQRPLRIFVRAPRHHQLVPWRTARDRALSVHMRARPPVAPLQVSYLLARLRVMLLDYAALSVHVWRQFGCWTGVHNPDSPVRAELVYVPLACAQYPYAAALHSYVSYRTARLLGTTHVDGRCTLGAAKRWLQARHTQTPSDGSTRPSPMRPVRPHRAQSSVSATFSAVSLAIATICCFELARWRTALRETEFDITTRQLAPAHTCSTP